MVEIAIKRDGRKATFDREKIKDAVLAAFKDVDGEVTQEAKNKASEIATYIKNLDEKKIPVEEIQDIVEEKLMASKRKDVAKAFIIYRNDRTREREKNSEVIKKVLKRVHASDVQNANANVDERSFSGREKEASADVGKTIALEFDGLSREVARAHKEMLVYQHDLEKAIIGEHNCLNLDFGEIFTYGFKTRNGDVRPPKSFSTACQLVAVAFQCQSQVQFGGVGSIHLDYDLAPFVKMSFIKHFQDGLKYLENKSEYKIDRFKKWFNENNLSIDNEEIKEKHPKVYAYAMDMLENEGAQSAQGLYHNLNTLESRQGSQVPFTSINLGRDTSPEGRLVTKWIMNASIDGMGEHHLTSIFPISKL